MKTRTVLLIAICVVSTLLLFLFIGTGWFSASAHPNGSWPAAILGALLLAFALGAPRLSKLINEGPEARGLVYGIILALLIIVLLFTVLYALL